MNCLKCGRETPAEQVFCEDCQLEMEKYPVKPGTVVLLPHRRENSSPKKISRRRSLPLEEQVKAMKSWIRILAVSLAVSLVLILVMVYPSIQYMMEDHFKIGQNYSSVTSTTAPTETVETIAD